MESSDGVPSVIDPYAPPRPGSRTRPTSNAWLAESLSEPDIEDDMAALKGKYYDLSRAKAPFRIRLARAAGSSHCAISNFDLKPCRLVQS